MPRMTRVPLLLLSLPVCLLYAGTLPDIPPSVLPLARMEWKDGSDPMNSRLFRTTSTRKQIDLAGWWDFTPDTTDSGESKKYFDHTFTPETQLWVPGTWNSQARYWNYIGAAWYARTFDLPQTANVRLVFSGVFYRAKVWLDGRCLAEHEGGYLPFSVLIKDVSSGTHSLVLKADNRLTDSTLPKRNVDWFPYGGIDRPVYAEIVPDTWVERLDVTATPLSGTLARLKVRAAIRNGSRSADRRIVFSVDGKSLYSASRRIAPGGDFLEFETELANPRLWSPEEPNLYSARLQIGAEDDQFIRFGVRLVEKSGSKLLLNGKAFKIRGVNRHADHPDWGSALPPQLIRQDIEIIKRLGANAVRAHYPLSELFLDYCDQNGLLFMSEAPAWQYRPEQLANPEVQHKIKTNLQQMIERDRTHPSILTWSLGNEWPDPDRSFDVVQSLIAYARTLDSTRLITLVTGGPNVWRVQKLVDVICINWARYQWYDPPTYLDEEAGRASTAALERIHQQYPGKPVILTEFGGSEAELGWHDWGNTKWSEEFQARNVEESARYAHDEDWLAGGCVWQFCDSRTAPERILSGRLHGLNAKGVLDGHRNPKLAFYKLQALFREWSH